MTTNTNPLWLNWDMANQIVNDLHSVLTEKFPVPTKIIAPIRGGLVPATILSHKMNVPVVTVDYSSYNGKGDNKNHANDLDRDLIGRLNFGEHVILIDDIVDSGETFREIQSVLINKFGVTVTTAALCVRYYSGMVPDVVGFKLGHKDGFVYFPWEQ